MFNTMFYASMLPAFVFRRACSTLINVHFNTVEVPAPHAWGSGMCTFVCVRDTRSPRAICERWRERSRRRCRRQQFIVTRIFAPTIARTALFSAHTHGKFIRILMHKTTITLLASCGYVILPHGNLVNPNSVSDGCVYVPACTKRKSCSNLFR